ncbi:MAG: helix-turn-helix transcriptional regulator [Candidatus Hydrogenedentes bacterium]|nr:helix-turn-helix transcriptional regulator [Candidatus Hydrogenedentota bacterium]
MLKNVTPLSPIIVHANWWQFAPHERIRHPRVESRMLLWCRQGRGSIRVNGQDLPFEPGCFAVLPWAHAIDYRPQPEDPLLVGAIHWLPYHDPGVEAVFEVAHHSDHPLAHRAFRRDVDLPFLNGLLCGHFKQRRPLEHLAEYIAMRFVERGPDEQFCRGMAEALVMELRDGATGARVRHEDAPGQLERMVACIEARVGESIRLEVLAGVGRCSLATVRRLFMRHYGMSPAQFVAGYKMDRAGELLRTSSLSVGEIARRVGFEDPLHFSKAFKKVKGQSPLPFRKDWRGL